MTALRTQELHKLIDVMTGLYQFGTSGPRGRTRLLHEAGLASIIPWINLDGPSAVVAADIIYKLENYGALPKEPGVQALGALLRHIITLGDLPQDDAGQIAELIVKYNLVADLAYQAELRKRYGFSVDRSLATLQASEQEAQATFEHWSTSAEPQLRQDLSGRELKKLHNALLSAFPDREVLAQMVAFELSEQLNYITGGSNLSNTVFELIEWARAQGRLGELIQSARRHNPGNAALRSFTEDIMIRSPHNDQ